MKITDVIGLTLKDAKGLFDDNGIGDYSVRVTSSPRQKNDDYDDDYRVVGIREFDIRKYEIIVCKPL
ncbi:MAG TPA: hypothetical protein PK604_06885 [Acetivibrio clariflavus]|nr:hypothetical protein [Acetivibrio clariflavus]